MRRICIFCGSSTGLRPEYAEAAGDLGRLLAARAIGVVYGGASVGIMGVLADAALAAGGEVIGVIPRALEVREVAHTGLTRLHVVGTMHERKGLMAELSDGFIALPGGFGTFEEFFEVITWGLLGIHRKPCGLLDVAGYYDPLVALIDRATVEGFIRSDHRALVMLARSGEEILEMFSRFVPLHSKD
jgi:uncharacterized protein (TIGR00730 family)